MCFGVAVTPINCVKKKRKKPVNERLKYSLLLLSAIVLLPTAQAQPIVLDTAFSHLMLGKEVSLWKTSADTLTAEAVLAMPDSAFAQAPERGLYFGLEQEAYWLRFQLDAEADITLILELVNPYIERFSFYLFDEVGQLQADTLGAVFPFSDRFYPHRNWQIPLTLPSGQHTCLLYVPPFRGPLQMDIYLWEHNARTDHEYVESAVLTAFFMIILVFLTLIFLVNQVARFRSLWYYFWYVAFGGMLLFSDLGLAYSYFWPEAPYLHQIANLVLANLYLITGIKFVKEYFYTHRFFPILNQAIIIIMGIAVSFLPFSALLPYAQLRFAQWFYLLHYLVFLAGFVSTILVFIMSVAKRQQVLAGWFLFGFGLHGLGIALAIGQYMGLLPAVSSTRWLYESGLTLAFYPQMAMMAGILIEVPVLFYVAFFRFRRLYEDAQRRARSREDNLNSLIMSIEQERKRLGQDLHDTLGVQLAAIKMKLSLLQEQLSGPESKSLGQAIRNLDQTTEEMRSISQDLMPPTLERQGLQAAIEHLLHRMQAIRPGLKAHFFNNAPLEQLTPEARIHLYRILLELIANAIKHAHASEISVQIVQYNGSIQATVEDNGQGFDMETAKKQGIGLHNIQYRAKALHGQFEMDSRPGRGTFASLEVPLRSVLNGQDEQGLV